MKILYVASEVSPFIKTGGLADVAGSLPKEIAKLGHDIRVVLPLYGAIAQEYRDSMKFITNCYVCLSWRYQYCGIFELKLDNVTYYFIDNEYYFMRDNLYGEYDDGERFAFFCNATLQVLKSLDFKPDVINANDWQCGLIPVYLELNYSLDEWYRNIKTVFTVHNIAYQGKFRREILGDVMGIDDKHFRNGYMEFDGVVNIMKAAMVASDKITTVSNTYAKEITTEYYGERLHSFLQQNTHKLSGILNGIDLNIYNPKEDKFIAHNYGVGDTAGKKKCRANLLKILGLEANEFTPIIGVVSRLVGHKGLNLIEAVLSEILDMDIRLVILGKGEWRYEEMFLNAQKAYPAKISTNIVFSEELSRKIYAGCDILLMPSFSEPCGLSQMISMRYGTIPIVRETGGLNDTVTAYVRSNGIGNGFTFTNYNAHDMLHVIKEACDLFRNDKKAWSSLMKGCMGQDLGWKSSASKYLQLYKSI